MAMLVIAMGFYGKVSIGTMENMEMVIPVIPKKKPSAFISHIPHGGPKDVVSSHIKPWFIVLNMKSHMKHYETMVHGFCFMNGRDYPLVN